MRNSSNHYATPLWNNYYFNPGLSTMQQLAGGVASHYVRLCASHHIVHESRFKRPAKSASKSLLSPWTNVVTDPHSYA
jgi:hypothetical protein